MYKKSLYVGLLALTLVTHPTPSTWTKIKGTALGTMVALGGHTLFAGPDGNSPSVFGTTLSLIAGGLVAGEYITTHDPVYQLRQELNQIAKHPLTDIISCSVFNVESNDNFIGLTVTTVPRSAEDLAQQINSYYKLHPRPHRKAGEDVLAVQTQLEHLLGQADSLCNQAYETTESASEVLSLYTSTQLLLNLYTSALSTLTSISK